MEFIKYFTNPQLDNAKFADMLRLKMNVRAKAVEDGVILDRDAFNAMSAALMPNWPMPIATCLPQCSMTRTLASLSRQTDLSTSANRQTWLLAIGVKRTASMVWLSLITTLAKSCTWQTKT